MKTNIEDISQTKKKISVNVPKEKIGGYVKRAYQKVGQKAKINGFRPGKVPSSILDKHFAADIDYESMNFLINDAYQSILRENDFFPIDEPKFDVKPLNREADYAFSIELEIKPKFELKDYKDFKLTILKPEVADSEIDEQLKNLQERMTQLAPADDGAVFGAGLVANIDFIGTVEDVPFEGGTAQDFQMDFDAKSMLPDFQAGVDGMKLGEEKTFPVVFPAEYFSKDLAGKTASFKATLKSLHKKTLPPIDDELAKDLEKESLDKLKEEIKAMLTRQKEQEIRGKYGEQLRLEIAKAYNFEVPESIVQKQTAEGKRERKEVEDQLRVELVLEAIARKEAFDVQSQDVERRIATMAQMYRRPVAEIRAFYAQNNMMPQLVSQILVDKALDFAVDNANMA